MQQGNVLPILNSENDVLQLSWDNGFWLVKSQRLGIEEKRIYLKQNQLTEVLEYLKKVM